MPKGNKIVSICLPSFVS